MRTAFSFETFYSPPEVVHFQGPQSRLPHIELEQVGHCAIAKIKEAILAVTGG